jgi:hypothetical protein
MVGSETLREPDVFSPERTELLFLCLSISWDFILKGCVSFDVRYITNPIGGLTTIWPYARDVGGLVRLLCLWRWCPVCALWGRLWILEFPSALPLYVCANHSEHWMKVASVWVAERTKVFAAPVGSKGRQESCLLKYWVVLKGGGGVLYKFH